MLTVKRTNPPTKTFNSVSGKGSLFEFRGETCLSLGWPNDTNNIDYVILASENKKHIGTTSSQHNDTPGVTLLNGELAVWLVS